MSNIGYRIYKLYESLAIWLVNRLYPNTEAEDSAAWMGHELMRLEYESMIMVWLHTVLMMFVCVVVLVAVLMIDRL